MNNKAEFNIGSLQGIIIAIMVIGIVLGLGFLMLREFEETMGDTVTTVINESINVTDTGIYVVYNSSTDGVYCYHSFTPIIFLNESGEITIAPGNYSYDSATGRIWNLTSDEKFTPLNQWNITYSYSHSDGKASCEGIEDTVDAMQEIPSWLVIIVIMLIVGILLAIVFKVVGGQGRTSAEI